MEKILNIIALMVHNFCMILQEVCVAGKKSLINKRRGMVAFQQLGYEESYCRFCYLQCQRYILTKLFLYSVDLVRELKGLFGLPIYCYNFV